jgi:hypothetical protein
MPSRGRPRPIGALSLLAWKSRHPFGVAALGHRQCMERIARSTPARLALVTHADRAAWRRSATRVTTRSTVLRVMAIGLSPAICSSGSSLTGPRRFRSGYRSAAAGSRALWRHRRGMSRSSRPAITAPHDLEACRPGRVPPIAPVDQVESGISRRARSVRRCRSSRRPSASKALARTSAAPGQRCRSRHTATRSVPRDPRIKACTGGGFMVLAPQARLHTYTSASLDACQ